VRIFTLFLALLGFFYVASPSNAQNPPSPTQPYRTTLPARPPAQRLPHRPATLPWMPPAGLESGPTIQNILQELNSPSTQPYEIHDRDIQDDIDLRGLKINRPIDLRKCHFQGKVIILQTEFSKPVSISNCWFDNQIECREATFNDAFTCSESNLKAGIFVRDTTFKYSARMGGNRVADDAPVEFAGIQFSRMASFAANHFPARAETVFNSVTFAGRTSFSEAEFPGNASLIDITCSQLAFFSKAKLSGSLLLDTCTFNDTVYFDQLQPLSNARGTLTIRGVVFAGETFAESMQLNVLRISRSNSPTVFQQRAILRRLRCAAVDCDANFRHEADFSHAAVSNSLSLNNASFEGPADFYDATFPAFGPVTIEDARLGSELTLDWTQLSAPKKWWQVHAGGLKVATTQPRTWQNLAEAFKRSSNLEGQNEAAYQARELTRTQKGELFDQLSWAAWGYQLRPMRVLIWFTIAQLIAAAWYLHCIRKMGSQDQDGAARAKVNYRYALKLAFKQAFSFGSQESCFGWSGWIHSFSSKAMLVAFLITLSNTSPLLNALIGKLIPL
jgi:hypothetical protein